MLQNLSDKMTGILAKIIILFICGMFALWGIHYYLEESKSETSIAKVNGYKITQSEFDTSYKREQLVLGSAGQTILSNSDIAKTLKEATLENLIRTKVLVDGAEKEKLFIVNSQVDSLIQQSPTFRVGQQFSSQLFQQQLSALGYSFEGFQEMVREKMLINQVELGITASAFSLPIDIANTLRLTEQKRNIEYVILPLNKVTLESPIQSSDINAYYEEHKENYAIPEQVQLQYVELSLTDLAKNKSLSNEEVEKQFSDFADKLDNITYENPNTLEPVAKAINTTLKQTDYFSRNDTSHPNDPILNNPKVRAAAFSDDVLHQGYNSSVINLDDNTEIVIRVLNRKPSSYQPIAAVQDSIKTILTKDMLSKTLQKEGEALQQALSTGKDPDNILSKTPLQWQSATDITQDSTSLSPELIQAAFNIPAKEAGQKNVVGSPLKSGDYLLIKLTQVNAGDDKNVAAPVKQQLASNIEKAYGSMDYKLYYDSLRNKASVKIYTNQFSGNE